MYEFGVRAALGAGRARLMRQLVAESIVLSLGAGVLGAALALVAVQVLVAVAPPGIPRLDEVRIDTHVLLFTAVASIVSGLLFGVAPAWKVARSDPNAALNGGTRAMSESRPARRTRAALVVAECALAMTLLTGAGLLVRSFAHMQARDPGLRPDNTILVRLAIPLTARERADRTTLVHQIYQEIIDRVATLPDVRAAGTISNFVFARNADVAITVEGSAPAVRGQLTGEVASAGYFAAMGIPLRSGRFFTRDEALAQDAREPTLAIVNESFARRVFPGQNPVGKRFREGGPTSRSAWLTIVGVVGDVRRQGLEKDAIPEFYYPGTMWWVGSADLVVRTSGDPLALAPAIRREVRAIEKSAVVLGVTTVERQMRELTAPRRFQTALLALFAAVALVMSAIGIYGVLHFDVAQRTREIGIRMAFGARAVDVIQLTLGEGVRLALLGTLLGVGASLALTRFMSSLLLDVSATDPLTLVAVSAVLLVAAVIASYVPARRAALVDPVIALRQE
jgi:predicted permease